MENGTVNCQGLFNMNGKVFCNKYTAGVVLAFSTLLIQMKTAAMVGMVLVGPIVSSIGFGSFTGGFGFTGLNGFSSISTPIHIDTSGLIQEVNVSVERLRKMKPEQIRYIQDQLMGYEMFAHLFDQTDHAGIARSAKIDTERRMYATDGSMTCIIDNERSDNYVSLCVPKLTPCDATGAAVSHKISVALKQCPGASRYLCSVGLAYLSSFACTTYNPNNINNFVHLR